MDCGEYEPRGEARESNLRPSRRSTSTLIAAQFFHRFENALNFCQPEIVRACPVAPFSPSHLRISRIATRIFPCAHCSWLLPARAFLLGEVAFPRREKVSRRRSARACLAGRASPTTPASSASLYSQLLSFIPLSFFFSFPYVRPASLLLHRPQASLWH